VTNPAIGEIFLPNDLEELKSKNTKKNKGPNIASNWKDRNKEPESDAIDIEFDDFMDIELLKDKRREEMLVYEQILFGERPDIYTVDPTNPKSFHTYDLEGNISNEFCKFLISLICFQNRQAGT